MKLNKILITLVLLLLAGVAIGPFIQLSNGTLNPLTAVWDATTAWDGGTKVDIDSATNSCLVPSNEIGLNVTGGSGNPRLTICPTGSSYVSKSNLIGSWDTGLRTPDGKSVPDQSGNNNLIFVINVQGNPNPISVPGPTGRGNGLYFAGQAMAPLSYSPTNGLLKNLDILTFTGWVRANSTTCTPGVCSLFATNGVQNGVQYAWSYTFACGSFTPGSAPWFFQYDSAGTPVAVSLGSLPCGLLVGWHSYAIRANYVNGSLSWFLDGALLGSTTMTTPDHPFNNDYTLTFGNLAAALSSDALRGSVADMRLFSRWLSNSEILNLATPLTFSTFGSWTSPNVETTNQTPIAVTLGYRNVSGSESFGPWVSGFSIFNSTTGLEFDSPGVMFSGTYNITYFTLSVFSNGSQIVPHGILNWTLEIDLQGDGNATAQLFYAAIIFQSLPIPTVTPKFAPTLDSTAIAILLLIFAFVFLFLTGFLERFLMVSAAIVAYIIGILSWTWTGQPFIPAIFVLVGTACIGLAMVIKPRQK